MLVIIDHGAVDQDLVLPGIPSTDKEAPNPVGPRLDAGKQVHRPDQIIRPDKLGQSRIALRIEIYRTVLFVKQGGIQVGDQHFLQRQVSSQGEIDKGVSR